MFMSKRMKVNLTQNETGELGMVIWLDTKSQPHAQGLVKQIVEMIQAGNAGQSPVDVGQFLRKPPPGIIKP